MAGSADFLLFFLPLDKGRLGGVGKTG